MPQSCAPNHTPSYDRQQGRRRIRWGVFARFGALAGVSTVSRLSGRCLRGKVTVKAAPGAPTSTWCAQR